ncbi:protein SMALL AUXIN UP-REGULATED RNA 51-like [Lotus japonicus]|uniref:protein SMALL AUXIN UP-REGULATED RNA 51-like n=1 Tax=Lotus japonicus TaxID=34305 RepID=UPI002584AA43|nr:protein SMALL AUXIN UP-REGULATED RNA 51-like [Lotus japonicus]
MKLSTITKLPSQLNRLASSSASPAFARKTTHKPLLTAGEFSDGSRSKVPKGFFAVYVGPEFRRFVIPISILAMPDFRDLMERVAEEHGCDHSGALEIPCDEEHFEHVLMNCYERQQRLSSKKHKIKLDGGTTV